jgi:putative DNA primase/helicase
MSGIDDDVLKQAEADAKARLQTERPKSNGNGTNGKTSSGDDEVDQELERLAKLTVIQYERERKDAAEKLGIKRVSILDKLVAGKKIELGLVEDDDGLQGSPVEFVEPELWPEPVDGAALLDAICDDAISKYVVMDEHFRVTGALWAVHTYLLDCFMISPRLGITAPVKGCGKTTLLDVLSRLVFRALLSANISPSSVFRVVQKYRPCTLMDEADTFLRDNEELRGVLNSGHRRGGSVVRTVGDQHEPRSFSTYSAVAIALIGTLPDTLADRSVEIRLKRKLASETVTSFRIDRVEHLDVLARKIARWARDNADAIRSADPDMPEGIYNRAADYWRPLLQIADVAGDAWGKRARQAIIANAQGGKVEEGSRIEQVLLHIREIFTVSDHLDRITSADVCTRLAENTDRPWAEYGKTRKPITPAALARLLKPLGITAQVIRVGDETARGYYRNQFDEAFNRFLGPLPPKCNSVTNAANTGTSSTFQSVTDEPLLHFENDQKPNNDGLCYTVTLSPGEAGEEGLSDEAIEPAESVLDPRFRIVSPADPDVACIHCGGTYGQVFNIRDTDQPGLKSEPLHEGCADDWFNVGIPPSLKREP